MKIRLSKDKDINKISVRISENEVRDLKTKGSLSETFFLSEHKSMLVVLNLSESGFKSTAEGFVLDIPERALESQKTKRDSAWEILVGEKLKVSVEVDLLRRG